VIFGTKREEVTDWRKLRTEELHDFYFALNIIMVIKVIKSILNGSRRNQMAQCGPDLSGSGQGPVAGSCERINEFLGPKAKWGVFC
jgi:hypothetical protein